MAYYVDPAWAIADPQGAQGALTRAQWRMFEDVGRPLELEALTRLTDPQMGQRNAEEAGALVSQAFDRHEGMAARRASRFGLQPTAEEQAVLSRRQGLSRALGIAGAENDARSSAADARLEMLASMMQIGRGISGQASEGLNSAAQMAFARDQAHDQAKASHKQSLLSTGLTGLGIALAAGWL